jgi:hypothetical protein
MVSTPVGMKCRDCGTSKGSPLYKVGPGRFVLAGLVALIAGSIAPIIGKLGFFVILLSMPYGYFVGSLILRAAGMKRGLHLEILTGSAIVIGGLLTRLLPVLLLASLPHAGNLPVASILFYAVADPLFLLAVGITAGCAVSKIRYL